MSKFSATLYFLFNRKQPLTEAGSGMAVIEAEEEKGPEVLLGLVTQI